MKNERLVLALAAVFAGMTVLMLVLAAAFRDPVPLFVALPFAAATYFFWYHATGRVATGIYERVERQARENASTDGGRGGFGAGPREDWRPPGGEDRWERVRGASRTARGGRRAQDGRSRSRGPNPKASSGPTAAEARRVLGVDADADESAVRRAYRDRAKETHPDTEGGDEAEFKRVNRAYERLTG
ncbi:molecular chaperone DnaJ [Halobacteriales archaeon QS_5_70_15]|nr:MAG: molecular chaperone DnaJ [Halobacteriales archaeon QS_5_70_15]